MTIEAVKDDVIALPVRPARTVIRPEAILRDRFELLAEIGRGGLSSVYKAKDLVAARAGLANPVVALKIIVEDADTDPDVIALMHREARRLRELVHPNIVRVYDMDVDGDAHFMVMELLEGQTLAKALREAPGHRLELRQVERLVADVSAALAFAHASNVIHADLKPGNIFIERSGRVKLIDFNIAYPVAQVSRLGEEDTVKILDRFGALTPIYASPERLSGAEPSEGDDVYSLAVIIHLALTGERPFGDLNALEAREKGLVPMAPKDLSHGRQAALAHALTLEDVGRTDSVARFVAEFMQPSMTLWKDWLERLAAIAK